MHRISTKLAACGAALLMFGAATPYAQTQTAPSQGPGGANLQQRIAAMDTNGDGLITRQEWTGRQQGFDRLDADRDGTITREELRAMRQAARQGAPGATGTGADR